MTLGYEHAVVPSSAVERCLHVLAAANHYQWTRWESFVIPALERGDIAAIERLMALAPEPLQARLREDAEIVTQVVEKQLGDFAYRFGQAEVLARKADQFRGWVTYARSASPESLRRWKLQCRTPFIRLTPAQQASDYVEARRDLEIIARLGGLVLPDALPQTGPMDESALRKAIRRHRNGLHAPFVCGAPTWSFTCLACERSWSAR